MRWTKPTLAVLLFILTVSIQPSIAQWRASRDQDQPARRAASRQEHDRITNAAFSSTLDDQGNARFTVKMGDFLLEKALASTGEATIRLTQGKDVVSFVIDHSGYVVGRGKQTTRLDSRSGRQEDVDAIRSLLVGSPAVRTFRRLVASMENREDNGEEGPLFLSALVDGAIVQMLDGDSGATERIGKRVTRTRRAGIRPVALRPGNLYVDCILGYELSLIEAWDLFGQCRDTAWNNHLFIWYFAENMCELEFLIRSQQYIYQFISCLAIP